MSVFLSIIQKVRMSDLLQRFMNMDGQRYSFEILDQEFIASGLCLPKSLRNDLKDQVRFLDILKWFPLFFHNVLDSQPFQENVIFPTHFMYTGNCTYQMVSTVKMSKLLARPV